MTWTLVARAELEVSACRGRLVSVQFVMAAQFGKKLHFSMGVNVWQLYKYVISIITTI